VHRRTAPLLRKITLTLATAATAAVALVPTAGAASPRSADAIAGARCVQAGVRFLVENDLLVAAARQQIDYDTIDSDSGGSEGAINTNLPAGSFLPLGAVIRLHFTNPELFDWCG
jgi:hypothetical protein